MSTPSNSAGSPMQEDNGSVQKQKNANPTENRPFVLKKWNALAIWAWDVECDTCAICRVHLMEFFHRQGVFKRVRSVIIRPSETPPTSVSRGILTRSLSARGDADKRRRTVLRRQNAMDVDDDQE
ncbi:hypothetical protein GCK72_002773 [Caenorhabditis remanei]|uniref:Anaphase-promoting complex subunit 11 RING-H2 finger domain-containing protein n=1 Tax=Caenorhabditis remanei TaxID=31234 RepID=A0A6A5HT87_CAERE|nr:hypothetical protein GCK72_002773 [Caenorhabditis remanei]KAF1770949.1 hypothetical protein GCK72_002773 [Caenorhabditis remanei]